MCGGDALGPIECFTNSRFKKKLSLCFDWSEEHQRLIKTMGTQFVINDSLQITREQGFPEELVYEEHLKRPFTAENFKERVFEFHDKAGIRFYHVPPNRNFLIENRDGKWIYWGLI